MTEHIIFLSPFTAPHAEVNAWMEANGLDPERVACTEATIADGKLTVTEFVPDEESGANRQLDPRGGGHLKRHRTVPLVVPFPAGLHTNSSEEDDK